MGEFRRASNEFRMQMEDELRMAEQAEQQKKIAAMEAAAPVTPAITDVTENTIANSEPAIASLTTDEETAIHPHLSPSEYETEPLPIATAGELNMMPPSTGLPEARSVSHAFDSVPHVPDLGAQQHICIDRGVRPATEARPSSSARCRTKHDRGVAPWMI